MPAQGNEAALLRRKTTDTVATLPAEDITLLFDEAESDYAGYNRRVIFQAVVVARLEELWTESTKHVTYQTNELRESLSDIAKALEKRLEAAKAKLDELLADDRPVAVGMGTARRVPTRWKDTP